MKILVTGNRGYIGSVLTDVLAEKGHNVIGYDTDYYRQCELYPLPNIQKQIIKDIRAVDQKDLDGIDAVVHLAALSNDPLGELNESLTEDINFKASITLAKLAKKAGVARFVYSSSQSMYGVSATNEELDEDDSEKNPVTIYAKTKWQAEQELKKSNSKDFTVVCLRPSTVFGASPRLRCDIVFNNLVACAFTTGKIEIKSDGTPWRPVVHVRDVSNAFAAALEAPQDLVSGQSFNVGIQNGNYTVRQLAEAAQRTVPESTLVFTGEHTDPRTYRVSFRKILTVLKDYFKPKWDLDRGGKELVTLFKKVKFTKDMFRGYETNRLKQINRLKEQGQLSEDLQWLEK